MSSEDIVSTEGAKFQFLPKETFISSSALERKTKLLKTVKKRKTKGMRDYRKKAGKFPYLLLGGG